MISDQVTYVFMILPCIYSAFWTVPNVCSPAIWSFWDIALACPLDFANVLLTQYLLQNIRLNIGRHPHGFYSLYVMQNIPAAFLAAMNSCSVEDSEACK
jgi:hypothetical protein